MTREAQPPPVSGQEAAATPVGRLLIVAPFVEGTVAVGAGPGPPNRIEIAAAVSRACAASSGIRRGVRRKAGDQISTAATTLPRASWTGAATAFRPSSYSPIAVA